MWLIKFQGREWLTFDPSEDGGAIFTAKRYRAGVKSYAHIYPSGSILRNGQTIGQIGDIEWIRPLTPEERPEAGVAAMRDILFGPFAEPEGWTDDEGAL
jgi:hypothetical protein